MTYPGQEVLLSVSDIAELVKVGRSAVSNWPKRYRDFPEPRTVTPSGALYDASEVERWLIEKGRITGPISSETRLWNVANTLRGVWPLSDVGDFFIACLVYLEACARSQDSGNGDVEVAQDDRWDVLRAGQHGDLLVRLQAAAKHIEFANPSLAGLIEPALHQEPRPDSSLVVRVLDAMVASRSEGSALADLLEEAIDRLHSEDRFFEEHDTPDDLAQILLRLASPIDGTVFDPAVGSGSLLLQASLLGELEGGSPHPVGREVDESALRRARARFFVYGVDADLQVDDSLRDAPTNQVQSDLVILDPPLGQHEWGNADLYVDPYWQYGVPTPASADFAWIQVALNSLKPSGRALVVSPSSDLGRGGREQEIRQALIDAQVIEAVVLLPVRMRRDTSVQLAVWVLRAAPEILDADSPGILLMDASELGTPGRSVHSFDESDIDRITEMVRQYRDYPYLEFIYDPLIAERESTGEINSGDTELFAISRFPAILVDANLNARFYQEAQPPDLDRLRLEVHELRVAIRNSAASLQNKLNDLWPALGDSNG